MIKQPNILYSKGFFLYDFDFGIWTQTFQISFYSYMKKYLQNNM